MTFSSDDEQWREYHISPRYLAGSTFTGDPALRPLLDSGWLLNGDDVGNVYVNRNQIGAVVGVQPFGGQGLSGTGPKAGGPHYLLRFATEKTVTVNTTAAGGNASLLTLGD